MQLAQPVADQEGLCLEVYFFEKLFWGPSTLAEGGFDVTSPCIPISNFSKEALYR